MKILPSINDLISIFSVFILTGVSFFVANLIFLKTTGLGAYLNTGYSMCKYEDPLLELLSIKDDECAWVPINLLVLYPLFNKENLEVGTNVCYEKQDSLVCHRIFKREEENGKIYYWIAGLNPNSLAEWVPSDKVKFLIIDKYPRAIGGNFFMILFAFSNPLEMYKYINKGFYI